MVSKINFPNNMNFGSYGDGDVSEEEEDRSDEIRQLVSHELENETFDDESEKSYAFDPGMASNGHLTESTEFSNLPSTMSAVNGKRVNGSAYQNGFETFQYPDLSKVHSEQENGFGSKNSSNSSVNGFSKKVRFQNIVDTPNGKLKGTDMDQSDRDDEEAISGNPTLSLMHKRHCPQTHPGGGDTWNSTDKQKVENLTALLELRENQVKKLEEEIECYSKDKRKLNHEIGVLKTEMAHMKNLHDDGDKVIALRDEEIQYLKSQLAAANQEFENVREKEKEMQDKLQRQLEEVERLNQMISTLKSVGSSIQQAEVDSVARQLREKSAKDIAFWKAKYADLESELQIFKRGHQNSLNESIVLERHDVWSQTDPVKFDTIKTPVVSKRDFATMANLMSDNSVTQEPVKQLTPVSPSPVLSVHSSTGVEAVIEKWRQTLKQSEQDKHRLVDFYEQEIQEYKTKLALLPTELFNMWTKQQEELGLLRKEDEDISKKFGKEADMLAAALAQVKVDAYTQVNLDHHVDSRLYPSESSRDSVAPNSEDMLAAPNPTDFASPSSTINKTTEKEVSSVVIQTEETLETFNVLGEVIQEWAQEVMVSAQRADAAEKEVTVMGKKLQEMLEVNKNLHQKYKQVVAALKKYHVWATEREETLKNELQQQKEKFIAALTKVSDKLDIAL